ncbi:MAG: phosphatidic acid phosphatase [Oscillospiraceae bacterium]|nr:phosphatidic acid phosphatase [Oscillospiraceae bacterium]
MKRQRVDYTGFSLSRLNEPRFSHIKLLGGWIIYFILFFLTENLIPREKCHPIHCWLDDVIPFNEFFLIFYCGWFLLVFGSLLYYLLYDVERFKKLQIYIMCTQAIAMFIYIVYPSRQDLRPEVFPRENILTALMSFIYAFDTSTGVCPSLHVGYSMAILSVTAKDPFLSKGLKAFLTFFIVMICAAVCFVKQHSAVDVFAALIMCFFIEIALFGKDYWLPRLRGEKA